MWNNRIKAEKLPNGRQLLEHFCVLRLCSGDDGRIYCLAEYHFWFIAVMPNCP